jgi:2-polyprenyl-6-methoxyphenol hydroxylase-like FAD-dependent oxidoreductase
MAVALFLHKHGIESTIYETRDEGYTSGGNIALAPNALRVLDHAGVYDKIRVQGYNYEEINFTSGVGVTLGRFLNGSQKKYNYRAIRIHRTYVRNALRDQCRAQSIKIHYEKRCTNVSEDGSNIVTVSFADGEIVTTDFVVGADGIHSHVRNHLAPDAEAAYFSGLMGIEGHVRVDELGHIKHGFALPAMLLGDSGSFAIMPSSFLGDEIGYFATLEAKDRSREEWDALDQDKQQLKKTMEARFVHGQSSWPEYVQALNKKTPAESFTSWP